MTNDEFLKRLGMEFRIARTRKELSQRELSKLAGLCEATCREIENGKVDSKILSYKRIADALGVNMKDFM